MIEEAFSALFVSGSVAGIGDRLYPETIPQTATLPAAAYQVVTSMSDHAHSGRTGYMVETVQITIDAKTVKEARDAAKTVLLFLDGKRPTNSDIKAIFYSGSASDWADGSKLTTIRQDYDVHYIKKE